MWEIIVTKNAHSCEEMSTGKWEKENERTPRRLYLGQTPGARCASGQRAVGGAQGYRTRDTQGPKPEHSSPEWVAHSQAALAISLGFQESSSPFDT